MVWARKKGIKAAICVQRVKSSPVGLAREAADVRPGEADAGEAEVEQHRHGEAEAGPGAFVVARPRGGVALHARPARAREEDGALVRLQREEAVVAGARHLHPVEVVRFAVVAAAPFETVADDVGQRAGCRLCEGGGFVHIVPEAFDAGIDKGFVELSPPCPCARRGEIGEGTQAGPDGGVVDVTVGRLAEVTVRQAVLVDGVLWVFLDRRIDDGDEFDALLAQVGGELRQIGEAVLIDGEAAVAVHIVDVQVDGVAGDVVVTEILRQFADAALRVVGPARLLVAEHPQRRQCVPSGEFGVAFDEV